MKNKNLNKRRNILSANFWLIEKIKESLFSVSKKLISSCFKNLSLNISHKMPVSSMPNLELNKEPTPSDNFPQDKLGLWSAVTWLQEASILLCQ